MSRLATVRRGAVVTLATFLFPALTAACADRQPTEPQENDQVRNVVRSYPGGCVPEATVTYEGSLEKTLITFTPVDTACSSNYFDVSSFGMDMADPVATDSPQGNMRWDRASGANLQNLPSPGYAAGGLNSVYQAFIEFDPPVRSVSFHFSSPVENAHWGGMGGPLQIGVDSMPVYAVSRTPGTIQYTIWDWEKLHANVASWEQLDVWDSVTLNAPWNAIQWLWFDGPVYIDDLEIVRSVGPALECSESERGQPGTCRITRKVDSVSAWHFRGSIPFGPSFAVDTAVNDTVWSGRVALSGVVWVDVVIDDSLHVHAYEDSLIVEARDPTIPPWRWDDSLWTYLPGQGLACIADYNPWYWPVADTIAENSSTEDCSIQTFTPRSDSLEIFDETFAADSILDGGPNHGLYFVKETYYKMQHGSYYNPSVRPSAAGVPVTSPANLKDCRAGKGVTSLSKNLHQFNLDCTKTPEQNEFLDWWAAVENHEGYGTPGHGPPDNGHQIQREIAAAVPQHDPYRIAEPMAGDSYAQLKQILANRIFSADDAIADSSASHTRVNGNWGTQDPSNPNIWCGNLYAYWTDTVPADYERTEICGSL